QRVTGQAGAAGPDGEAADVHQGPAGRGGRVIDTKGYWLVPLDDCGSPDLRNADGPHGDATGVARARYLWERLSPGKSRHGFVMARVTDVAAPSAEGIDEESLATMEAIMNSGSLRGGWTSTAT